MTMPIGNTQSPSRPGNRMMRRGGVHGPELRRASGEPPAGGMAQALAAAAEAAAEAEG